MRRAPRGPDAAVGGDEAGGEGALRARACRSCSCRHLFAGRAMQEIESLDLLMIEAKDEAAE